MEQPYKPNIVCVLADLSQIPRQNRGPIYRILNDDSQAVVDAKSRHKIKGLTSTNRILNISLLENILSGETEFLKQIKEYSSRDSIYILTQWETPEDKETFYQSDLHGELSQHGMYLKNQGVRLIVFQYIKGELSEPVIIP